MIPRTKKAAGVAASTRGNPEPAGSSPTSPARAERGSGRSGGGSLSSETETLSRMIGDLESQLDRMFAINDALQKDLEAERKRRIALERSVEELEAKLRSGEREAAARENLLAEIAQANRERTRLAASIEDLDRKLAETERECTRQTALVDRLRAARTDALEEVQGVEAQFERAMQMVTDLRTRLTVLGEERDAVQGRMKVTEDKLRHTEKERDQLLAEVDQSRAALDEIRRSLVDACVVSSQALTEDDEVLESIQAPRTTRQGRPGEGKAR